MRYLVNREANLGDVSKRLVAKATRAALERLFKFWHRTYAKKHFTLAAFSEYYEAYSWNYKIRRRVDVGAGEVSETPFRPIVFDEKSGRLVKLYIRKGASRGEGALPLVKSGALRQKFLAGSYMFGGSDTNLTVRWTGLGGPSGNPKIRDALVYVSSQELAILEKKFNEFLQIEIDRADGPGARTFGRFAA